MGWWWRNITVIPPHPPLHSNEPNIFTSRCALYIVSVGNLLWHTLTPIYLCLDFEADISASKYIYLPVSVLYILGSAVALCYIFCPDFEPACSIYCFGVEICCCFLSRLCRQYLKMGYWQLLCWKYQTSCCQTQKATIVKHREDISLTQVKSPGFQKVDVYWKMKIHDLNLLLSCK